MPNTKSNRYSTIASWIEKVIDSCDSMKMEQEKVCDNLIINLTNQILFITNDVPLSAKLDRKLLRKLIKKFTLKNKTKTIMQTLVFNTTIKTVKLYDGEAENSTIVYTFDNVPTVKAKEEGLYEVMQKDYNDEGKEISIPVARFPISNTNMIIKR